jgi:hypothetical protein
MPNRVLYNFGQGYSQGQNCGGHSNNLPLYCLGTPDNNFLVQVGARGDA